MSKPIPRPNPEPTCRECGATNDPGASECWLCQRRDWRGYPGPLLRDAAANDRERAAISRIGGWLILIAFCAVLVGLLREAPGLALALLIPLVPALVATEVKARRRYRRGEPMSGMAWALSVIVLTFVISISLFLAAAIALFLLCFATR